MRNDPLGRDRPVTRPRIIDRRFITGFVVVLCVLFLAVVIVPVVM